MPKTTFSRRARGAAIVCVIATATFSGCAKHRGSWLEVHPPAPGAPSAAPPASLSSFIEKVQKLAAEASAVRRPSTAATLESTDPGLGAALVVATATPSPQTYRLVAAEYTRLGIVDVAHEYLNRALRMDPADATTYEALARLWRDWGASHLALGDAHRAVYYAPAWAVAHNTLGTVLQAIGRRKDARDAYERTLQLEPAAAYALNNLCYGWILEAQTKKAIAACRRALEIEPGLRAAQNNLGLAHAAANDITAARDAFGGGGDRAATYYNLGIVHLARREYQSAVKAFETAQTLRPEFKGATVRARQARELSNGGSDE